MEKRHVIISVRGGLVTHVCSNDPTIRVSILDYDNFEQGDAPDAEDKRNMSRAKKSRAHGTKIDNKIYTTL